MTSINAFSLRKNRKQYSTFNLFPKPSTIHGIGSLFNICGNYYHFKTFQSPNTADEDAIENDWGVIGNDILNSIYELKKSGIK